jgi:hypothetical protein
VTKNSDLPLVKNVEENRERMEGEEVEENIEIKQGVLLARL